MMVSLSLAALVAVVVLFGVALRLRAARDAALSRALVAERLATTHRRCLSIAAEEIGAIAAGMRACRHAAAGPGARPTGICITSGGHAADGPVQQLLRLADDLARSIAIPPTQRIEEALAHLGPIVDSAVATVRRQIAPGRRHWQVDPALRALTVKADRRALEGALAALLRRAASHSRDGDLVALRWVVASETVAIVVEDEGDGLSAHALQAETGSSQTGLWGLDLGLSLARSLAAAHGGDIRLETAPGIGARAWLTLPRARLLEAA